MIPKSKSKVPGGWGEIILWELRDDMWNDVLDTKVYSKVSHAKQENYIQQQSRTATRHIHNSYLNTPPNKNRVQQFCHIKTFRFPYSKSHLGWFQETSQEAHGTWQRLGGGATPWPRWRWMVSGIWQARVPGDWDHPPPNYPSEVIRLAQPVGGKWVGGIF